MSLHIADTWAGLSDMTMIGGVGVPKHSPTLHLHTYMPTCAPTIPFYRYFAYIAGGYVSIHYITHRCTHEYVYTTHNMQFILYGAV